MEASNITPGHVWAFQAVTTGSYGAVTLWNCQINGEQGVALVLVDQSQRGQVAVMPLFVAITDSMKVVFEGEHGGSGGGGGGPKNPREAFEAGKADVTSPSPA